MKWGIVGRFGVVGVHGRSCGRWVRLGMGAFVALSSLSAAQRPLHHASRFGDSFGWAGLSGSFA